MLIRFFILIALVNSHCLAVAQNSLTHPARIILGNVAYYFWEEQANGSIVPNSTHRPFKQNYLTSFQAKKQHTTTLIEQNELIADVRAFLTQLPQKNNLKFWYPTPKKTAFELVGKMDTTAHSVLFIKSASGWKTYTEKQVLYFTINEKNDTLFDHSSDSLISTSLHCAFRVHNHYRVYKSIGAANDLSDETILDYNNKKLFTETRKSKRYLIFANGYRGPKKEKNPSDNLVVNFDRHTYWFQTDNRFVERLNPTETYYLDGSLSLKTSNYRTKIRFGWMLLHEYLFPRGKGGIRHLKRINKRPNYKGFQERFFAGKIAGTAFLATQDFTTTKDTIDIVCHSMGYAYALGFIETVKNCVVFGKMYIIAPENSTVGQADWSLFQEVWQYGANLDQEHPDPFFQQDGIAPQAPVKGLENSNPLRYGRIFTPANWPKKDIIEGHMVYSFDWIFDSIPQGSPGYIFRTF
jgi:hypothetical protein